MSATKLSLNVSSEVVEAIEEIATANSSTKTDAICKSIGTQKYIENVLKHGGKVLIEDKDGKVRQLVW